VKDVRGSEGGKYANVIANRVEELGLQKVRIGITGSSSRPRSDTLRANQLEVLQRKLPNSEFVFTYDLLHQLMHLKSDEEIERVKAAGKICDAAVQAMAERSKPGIAEYQLAAAAAHAIMDNGGEPQPLLIMQHEFVTFVFVCVFWLENESSSVDRVSIPLLAQLVPNGCAFNFPRVA
jgi:Xaa-Pro aminopeptidase